MFNVNAVSNKITLVNTVNDDDITSYYFSCNEAVVCSGAEYSWGYTKNGDVVIVTGINVHDNGDYCDVNVVVADERVVYMDDAFNAAISAMLNMEVDYTEQGMQDYGLVSMEA
jgi:hypothetical protein